MSNIIQTLTKLVFSWMVFLVTFIPFFRTVMLVFTQFIFTDYLTIQRIGSSQTTMNSSVNTTLYSYCPTYIRAAQEGIFVENTKIFRDPFEGCKILVIICRCSYVALTVPSQSGPLATEVSGCFLHAACCLPSQNTSSQQPQTPDLIKTNLI